MKDKNRIKTEINEAKQKYYFKMEDEEKDIVEISKDNVLLAEAIYQIRFRKYHNEIDFKKPLPDSKPPKWSAKNCFEAMKENELKKEFNKLLGFACIAVNAENSTHLRSYERDAIVERIIEEYSTVDCFMKGLTNKKYPIVGIIRGLKGSSKEGKIIRDNYSFATKLCHYACFYLFEDENRDLYSIYDSVLEEALKKRGVKINLKDYKEYQKAIKELIEKNNISRNGFDHLMWVYYSGVYS